MRKAALALVCTGLLAACGADGEPTPPPPKETARSGVSITGTARIGASVSRGTAAFPTVGG